RLIGGIRDTLSPPIQFATGAHPRMGEAGPGLWIPECLTPGCTTHIGMASERVARIRTVDVAFAFRCGIAVVELPIHETDMGFLCHSNVEDRSYLVPPGLTAA